MNHQLPRPSLASRSAASSRPSGLASSAARSRSSFFDRLDPSAGRALVDADYGPTANLRQDRQQRHFLRALLASWGLPSDIEERPHSNEAAPILVQIQGRDRLSLPRSLGYLAAVRLLSLPCKMALPRRSHTRCSHSPRLCVSTISNIEYISLYERTGSFQSL